MPFQKELITFELKIIFSRYVLQLTEYLFDIRYFKNILVAMSFDKFGNKYNRREKQITSVVGYFRTYLFLN